MHMRDFTFSEKNSLFAVKIPFSYQLGTYIIFYKVKLLQKLEKSLRILGGRVLCWEIHR